MEGEEEERVACNGFWHTTQTHRVRTFFGDMLKWYFYTHSDQSCLFKSFLCLTWGIFFQNPSPTKKKKPLTTKYRGARTERLVARESSAMVATPAKAAAAVYPAETVTKTMAVSVVETTGKRGTPFLKGFTESPKWCEQITPKQASKKVEALFMFVTFVLQ